MTTALKQLQRELNELLPDSAERARCADCGASLPIMSQEGECIVVAGCSDCRRRDQQLFAVASAAPRILVTCSKCSEPLEVRRDLADPRGQSIGCSCTRYYPDFRA